MRTKLRKISCAVGLSMKWFFLAVAIVAMGCEQTQTVGQCGDGNTEGSQSDALSGDDAGHNITAVGPDYNSVVDLSLADVWVVPPLAANATDEPSAIVWTLSHPDTPARVSVVRTCSSTHEPFLWLSDPPDWGNSSALATFHACGEPGEFYSTIELFFDGVAWIGLSATGAATVLPPE